MSAITLAWVASVVVVGVGVAAWLSDGPARKADRETARRIIAETEAGHVPCASVGGMLVPLESRDDHGHTVYPGPEGWWEPQCAACKEYGVPFKATTANDALWELAEWGHRCDA